VNSIEESRAIAELQRKGYTVYLSNPFSDKFNIRYTTVKLSNRIEGRLILVDENGVEQNESTN
jgi:hypothetical protein